MFAIVFSLFYWALLLQPVQSLVQKIHDVNTRLEELDPSRVENAKAQLDSKDEVKRAKQDELDKESDAVEVAKQRVDSIKSDEKDAQQAMEVAKQRETEAKTLEREAEKEEDAAKQTEQIAKTSLADAMARRDEKNGEAAGFFRSLRFNRLSPVVKYEPDMSKMVDASGPPAAFLEAFHIEHKMATEKAREARARVQPLTKEVSSLKSKLADAEKCAQQKERQNESEWTKALHGAKQGLRVVEANLQRETDLQREAAVALQQSRETVANMEVQEMSLVNEEEAANRRRDEQAQKVDALQKQVTQVEAEVSEAQNRLAASKGGLQRSQEALDKRKAEVDNLSQKSDDTKARAESLVAEEKVANDAHEQAVAAVAKLKPKLKKISGDHEAKSDETKRAQDVVAQAKQAHEDKTRRELASREEQAKLAGKGYFGFGGKKASQIDQDPADVEEIQELETVVTNAIAAEAKLARELDALGSALKDVLAEKDSLDSDVDVKKEALDKAIKSRKEGDGDVEKQAQLRTDADKQLTPLQQRVGRAENEAKDCDSHLEQTQTAYKAAINNLNENKKAHESATEGLTKCQTSVAQKKVETDEARSNEQHLRKNFEEAEEKVKRTEAALTRARQAVADAERAAAQNHKPVPERQEATRLEKALQSKDAEARAVWDEEKAMQQRLWENAYSLATRGLMLPRARSSFSSAESFTVTSWEPLKKHFEDGKTTFEAFKSFTAEDLSAVSALWDKLKETCAKVGDELGSVRAVLSQIDSCDTAVDEKSLAVKSATRGCAQAFEKKQEARKRVADASLVTRNAKDSLSTVSDALVVSSKNANADQSQFEKRQKELAELEIEIAEIRGRVAKLEETQEKDDQQRKELLSKYDDMVEDEIEKNSTSPLMVSLLFLLTETLFIPMLRWLVQVFDCHHDSQTPCDLYLDVHPELRCFATWQHSAIAPFAFFAIIALYPAASVARSFLQLMVRLLERFNSQAHVFTAESSTFSIPLTVETDRSTRLSPLHRE